MIDIEEFSDLDFAAHAERHGVLMDQIHAGLVAFNQASRPDPNAAPLTLVGRDPEGNLVGGLTGRSAWDWLRIDVLWVDEAARGRGLGRALMQRAQRVAERRGCCGMHLDTFGFQAPDFYIGLGFEVFGALPGEAHQGHFFLSKRL